MCTHRAVRAVSLRAVSAEQWYINLDKAIKHVNANGTITLKYSTPSEYVKARNAEAVQWPTKTDDFFPVSAQHSAQRRARALAVCSPR